MLKVNNEYTAVELKNNKALMLP